MGFGFFYDFGAFSLTNDFDDKADAQAHSFGGYLTWRRDCDYFMFIGGGGFADYHATRCIELENPDNVIARTAQGTSQGGQAALYGEYGRNIQWENANLRPYVGVLYMNVLQQAFAETGAGAFDLSFDESSINSFRTLLGSQLDFRCARCPGSFGTCAAHGRTNASMKPRHAPGRRLSPGFRTVSSRLPDQPPAATGASWAAACAPSFFSKHLQPFANCDLVLGNRQSLYAGTGGIEYAW